MTYGSRTPRIDMKNGRVGSIFSDPSLVNNQSDAPKEQIIEQVDSESR
jgi:hypothetical protein